MTSTPIVRTVYIVSDSTGITAETFSQSVLSQFEEVDFKPVRLPFVDTLEKAAEVAMRIDRSAQEAGVPPIVFSTIPTSWRVFARRTEFSWTCSAPSSATSSRRWD